MQSAEYDNVDIFAAEGMLYDEDDDDDGSGWAQPFDGGVWVNSEQNHRSAAKSTNEKETGNLTNTASTVTSNVASSSSIVSRMALNDNKAGMDGLNKEKINKIILEASKGSRFYENERKKEAQVNQRMDQMKQKLACISEHQKTAASAQVDLMVTELEASRRFNRSIIHLDMDAFYAAVEMRDNPSLKNKPMAVGGMSMLSTSNYLARRYGVRAAMPGFIGKKLCPELIITPLNFDKYRAVSQQVREILAVYDPNFCPMSLDEAYFDLTDHLERRKSMHDAERTFEYGEWNQDSTWVVDNEGAVQPENGISAKLKDEEKEGNSDTSGRQDTKMRFGLASDDAHIVSSLDGNDIGVSLKTETPCLRTPESTLDNPELSPLSLSLHIKQQTSNTHIGPISNEDSSSGMSFKREMPRLLTPESALDNSKHSSANSSCTGNEDIPSNTTAISSRQRRCRTFGLTVEDVVEEIRFRIEQKTQLTASAGIAPNTMLAKICSDKNKPNGQYRILPNRNAVMEFIRELPIRKVSGIGKVTEKLLSALGIQTCTDLFQQRALLHLLFSPTSSHYFLRISLGLGSTRVERDGERKSMSTERTFNELHRPADLFNKCNELCQALAEDLQKEELMGKTVTIKLKTVKFEVKTKASSVPAYIQTADCIFNVAKDLLKAEINGCKPEPLRLRLMGVRISNLQACGALSANKQDSITKFFKKRQLITTPNHQQVEAQTESKPMPSTSSINGPQLGTNSDDCISQTFARKDSVLMDSSESQVTKEILKSERQRSNDDDGIEASIVSMETQEELSIGDQQVESSGLICPVCNVPQLCTDLEVLNKHVDLCLNRSAIREMLLQQASQDGPSSSRSTSSPTKGKRSSSGPKSASKRHKQEKAQTNTLDKFFC